MLVFISILFVGIIIYMSYFEIFRAAAVRNNSYNRRLWINEEHVLRGQILDRNNKVLAYSEIEENKQTRHYNYGSLYSHVIGYSFREYGKSGLEASYNNELLNMNEHGSIKKIRQIITNEEDKGNNLILTIDHDIQSQAHKLLRGKKGSIVVMNPTTGEIYSMVSNPDFNPSNLQKEWGEIIEDNDSPLLNRATMGLYPPGSAFKVITLAGALDEMKITDEFNCTGSINVEGYNLRNFNGVSHGTINLEDALAKSCNVTFAQLGLSIGHNNLKDISEGFMLNKSIPFDLKTKTSIFPKDKIDNPELAASAIGQGNILVTPLHMAMVASAIANGGEMVRPILVNQVISSTGRLVSEEETKVLSRTISEEIAEDIKEAMVKAVHSGTGKKARIKNLRVAGKTGTAENSTGKSHAWFIGFAPADNPKVAIAVVLESSGTTGGDSAAPIAKELMESVLKKIK